MLHFFLLLGVGGMPFRPAHNRWCVCVCVCVAVTTLGNMESDLSAQSSSYLDGIVLIGDNCSHIEVDDKQSPPTSTLWVVTGM